MNLPYLCRPKTNYSLFLNISHQKNMNFGGTKLKKVLLLIAVVAVSFVVCEFAYAQATCNKFADYTNTIGC